MLDIKCGDHVFHKGLPVELLYRIPRFDDEVTWRVRPLFVRAEDRNEHFGPHDEVSYLHTRKAAVR